MLTSESTKKEVKEAFMKSLVVKLDNDMQESLKIVDEFKYQYYIGSKEVQHMTDKACLIIGRLFNYYLEHPEMLPDECLEQYFSSVDGQQYDTFKELVWSYLFDEYKKIIANKKAGSKEDDIKDMKDLADRTKNMIIEENGKEKDPTKNQYIEGLEKIHDIAKGLHEQNEKKQSLIRKGRQANLFENDLVKTNENLDPFASKNHVSKTILARVIADYIGGMTDRMAILKYNEIETSSTTWTEKYNA